MFRCRMIILAADNFPKIQILTSALPDNKYREFIPTPKAVSSSQTWLDCDTVLWLLFNWKLKLIVAMGGIWTSEPPLLATPLLVPIVE